MQGGKREDSEEIEFGFWIWEENWEREEREEVTENSRMEGRRGERRRAENQPSRGEEVGREEGRTVPEESWKEGEVRKPVTMARRVAEEEVSSSSSERVRGRGVTWPKRRPWREEGAVEKRWMWEARVGPEVAIFCNG